MVSSVNLERRISALEQVSRREETIVIPIISAELGETSDAAVARYAAGHGDPPKVEGDRVNAIVLIPVTPLRLAETA